MSFARWTAYGPLATVALVFTGSAAWGASEPGWYYGISGGSAQADLKQAELDEFADFVLVGAGTPLSSSSTLEDSDTAWSLFFGYQLSPYVAFEAGYLKLGSFPYRLTGTIDLTGPEGAAPSSFGFEFKSSGYPVSVIGMLPVGQRFEIHGRAGLFFSNTKVNVTATAGNASLADTLMGSDQDFFYGVGAAMNLTDSWSIGVDWLQYKDVGNKDDTSQTDMESISLALFYHFGLF